MKKLFSAALLTLLSLSGISRILAQDVVTVKPVRNTSGNPNNAIAACSFNFTISNHNTQQKNIDGVRFSIVKPLGGLVNSVDLKLPAAWGIDQVKYPQTDTSVAANATNAGIAPNATLGGFVLSYLDNNPGFETPVSVLWIASGSGGTLDLDSGIVPLLCTEYQSFNTLDSFKFRTFLTGQDPCFAFTLHNSDTLVNQSSTIKYVSFEIFSGGTMRPAKITPPAHWFTDSVTASRAYFHAADNWQVNPGDFAGEFIICARGIPQPGTKYSFDWEVRDEGYGLIDRDTIRNITSVQATGAPNDADSVALPPPSGCLYTITVKDYHVSNTLPPSRIVRFKLFSKTAGVQFDNVPSLPAGWNKTITAAGDSLIFFTNSDAAGIPGGTLQAFQFSMKGSTSAGFSLGWETDKAAAGYPPKYIVLSQGSLDNIKCTVAAPSSDVASIAKGQSECSYILSMTNAHNITPQSLDSFLIISIPSGAGRLTPNDPTNGWTKSSTSATQIKYQSSAGDQMAIGASADFPFSFLPSNPGQDVILTWKAFDVSSAQTGTGTFTINCSPPITTCDTFRYVQTISQDSCVNTFTNTNYKASNVMSIVISPTNGWVIDTASTPLGWVKALSSGSVSYSASAEGLATGQSLDFTIKFIGLFPDTSLVDTFHVVTVSTDAQGKTCTGDTLIRACKAHALPTKGVAPQKSETNSVANFAINPNPSRGEGEISFDLSSNEFVWVTLVDILGHERATISSKLMQPGSYHIPYVMNNLSDGIYYIRMQTPFGVMTKKLVISR